MLEARRHLDVVQLQLGLVASLYLHTAYLCHRN
jgi:hypothetical protein